MDFLALIQAPINTLLVMGGFALVFLSFFDISKKGITQKKKFSSNNLIITGVGALIILSGIFYKPPTNAQGEEAPTQEVRVEIATNFDTATSVPTDTPAATETLSPTETSAPPTDTATAVSVKTFEDGCIAVQTWQARSIDINALNSISDQNNCWNLNGLGIVAEPGGTLHFLTTPSSSQTGSGIYTTISDHSVIEFNVYVNNFYLVYNDNPGYIGFSIAPQDNPMATRGSGRFKLQVKQAGSNPIIFFMLADTNESNGTELGTQHYLNGRTYKVRMELQGISMDLYINDVKLRETLSVPSGPKVFYIGYNLPISAKADVEISDISIDGVEK